MTQTRTMVLILIISFFTYQNTKSMETDYLLEKEDRYGICIPITVPILEKAQWINEVFVTKHKADQIIPHIALLQAYFTKDQLTAIKTYLTEFVKTQNSFEIRMSPQIVAAENNSTIWCIENTCKTWNKLQETHLFLKTGLPITLKSQINFIGNTYPHYKPHCTVAYNIQDETLNDHVNHSLLGVARYLKFMPHVIALTCIDSFGNIKSILQYFKLNEDLALQKNVTFHTNVLFPNNEQNTHYSKILAHLLDKHYLNKPHDESNKENDLLIVDPSSETSSSEEEE